MAMAGGIPQSFINGLLDRVDIVDVVGTRVQLRRAGANHMGLCPFHDEKTPSFHVYADGHFHCYGCGAHGTPIGFLMDADGLTFPEAVEALAGLVGVEVPRQRSSGKAPDRSLYAVLEAANERFQAWLAEDAEARAYLDERGVSAATAGEFGLGLAPAGWERLKTALHGFDESKLQAAGLLASTDGGRVYDRFRERITFPIRDTRGRVVGFGGRTYKAGGGQGTDGTQPKYLNSPETEVFKKGRELYGLFEARRARRRLESVVVVEGYMDVVALAQHGIDNAVATLGTAVGEAHFERLYRHVNDVVCCFDGDDAGRGAAWKAVAAAFPVLAEGRQLRFAFLPEGEDPDTLVRRRGATEFQDRLRRGASVGEYFLAHQQQGLDLLRLDHRALLCDQALPALARLPAGTLRTMLVERLADLGQTDGATLEQRLRSAPAAATPASPPAPRPLSKLGGKLLRLLVGQPRLFKTLDADEGRQFAAAAAGDELLGEVLAFVRQTPDADAAALLGRFLGEASYGRLAALAEQPLPLPPDACGEEFAAGVRRYVAEDERRQRASIRDAVRHSDSLADLRQLRNALS